MDSDFRKIWEIITTNETFQEKENKKLIQLFMKITATQVPQKFVNEITEILIQLLSLGWCNTKTEEQHLSDILTELRKE